MFRTSIQSAKEAEAEALEQAIHEDLGVDVDGEDLMRGIAKKTLQFSSSFATI